MGYACAIMLGSLQIRHSLVEWIEHALRPARPGGVLLTMLLNLLGRQIYCGRDRLGNCDLET